MDTHHRLHDNMHSSAAHGNRPQRSHMHDHRHTKSRRRFKHSNFFPSLNNNISSSISNNISNLSSPSLPTPPTLYAPNPDVAQRRLEPFWWQYPRWTRPDSGLYFYPGIGFREQPLYWTIMDGKNVIIGHKSPFSKPKVDSNPLQKPIQARAPRPMVDVYNGKTFVERISLHTLVRFSTVASTALPRRPLTAVSVQAAPPGSQGTAQDVKTITEGLSDLHVEAKSSADDASTITSDKHEASVAEVSSPGPSFTPPTSITASTSTKTGTSRKILARGEVENVSAIVKKLKLSMDVYYLPTIEAMKYAIKWMKDNSRVAGDGKLMPFGPDKPQDAAWVKLLDHYAAAVLLDLRPFPKTIRQELMDRITEFLPFDLYDFSDVINYLPVDDPVVTRATNQFYHNRRKNQYTKAQLDDFRKYLDSDPFFKPYLDKINENAKWHDEVTESRRRERADKARAEYWSGPITIGKAGNVGSNPKKLEENVEEKGGENGDDAQPRGRRRNRRAQQAKGNGKGKDGAHVPGAEY